MRKVFQSVATSVVPSRIHLVSRLKFRDAGGVKQWIEEGHVCKDVVAKLIWDWGHEGRYGDDKVPG